MEVTKSNFASLLPNIKKAISESHFITIDCEFTGLNIGANINGYDTQAQYYSKVRKAAKEFLVVQYGLCIFRYDSQRKVFKQQGYNFYIFPRPTSKLTPDHKFLCQASSIDFLSSQGFDFTKLFKEGIPYLNSTEEDQYGEDLSEKQKTRLDKILHPSSNEKSNIGIAMSPEDKVKVDDIFHKIEEFIQGDDEEYILPRCNAFIRRLVYGEAPLRIGNRAILETRILDNKDRILVITRAKSIQELEKEDRQKADLEEKEFKACIGFSEVIKCIVESRKLIVGHNIFLDLLHTIEQFLVSLPDDYNEFRELASSVFSNFVDTKYMCSINPLSAKIDSSVLPHLFDAVKKEPFALPDVEVEDDAEGYTLNCDKSHEAGYDAFITGICFLGMWMYLGNEEYEDSYNVFTDPSSLSLYKNRLFLMKVQDISCINLAGPDVVPNRNHILHLSFPKQWKNGDIQNLFSSFGSINIAWIDDQSAYVALQSPQKATTALRKLSKKGPYTITYYPEYQTQLGKNKPVTKRPSFQNQSFRKRRSTTTSGNSEESFSISNETITKKILFQYIIIIILSFVVAYNLTY